MGCGWMYRLCGAWFELRVGSGSYNPGYYMPPLCGFGHGRRRCSAPRGFEALGEWTEAPHLATASPRPGPLPEERENFVIQSRTEVGRSLGTRRPAFISRRTSPQPRWRTTAAVVPARPDANERELMGCQGTVRQARGPSLFGTMACSVHFITSAAGVREEKASHLEKSSGQESR